MRPDPGAVASPAVSLVVNPRSGGGVHQAKVRRVARERGLDVREVRADADPSALALAAVDEDAEILGAAGGDGTVSAVAGVAVARDVPLLVVPCGTRNHFAKDCGADVTDPAAELATLENGRRGGSMWGRSTGGSSWTTRRSASTRPWCAIRTTATAG
jgi:diacylglycerol kinase family enzyme